MKIEGTCFLHIGPHKTGSSAIQQFLFDNAAILAQDGFHVPEQTKSSVKGNHRQILNEFAAAGTRPRAPSFVDDLRTAGFPRRVVLSAEAYAARVPDRNFVDRLADYFMDGGYALTVIAYVRPQVSLANSVYTQRVKLLRSSQPFDSFLDWYLAKSALSDYGLRFGVLAGHRRIACLFIPYTSALVRDGQCADFLNRIGASPDLFARCLPPPWRNTSPGPKTIAAMRHICAAARRELAAAPAEYALACSQAIRRMADAKGWNDERFDGLDAAAKRRVIAHFRSSNAAFARQAWGTDWEAHFAADEAEILTRPGNAFDPALAPAAEAKDFREFCEVAVAFIREFSQGQAA
jgi:hypothetical protein